MRGVDDVDTLIDEIDFKIIFSMAREELRVSPRPSHSFLHRKSVFAFRVVSYYQRGIFPRFDLGDSPIALELIEEGVEFLEVYF